MGTRMNDKHVNYSHRPTQTKQQSWLMHNWNTFGARMSHGHTWIHKTHHNLDLREATTFFLIVFFMISHGATCKCHFVSGWEF
jgi:hypothetical protein